MQAFVSPGRISFALGVTLILVAAPHVEPAQSGNWVATISQLGSAGGAADVTVAPRNDKQSRAKITFRNTRRDMQLAWDIVQGRCGEDGAPIAAQAAFTKVQTQLDGGGTATSNVPKLESGKNYYVRVFDPQEAPRDSRAHGCANLSEKP